MKENCLSIILVFDVFSIVDIRCNSWHESYQNILHMFSLAELSS